MSAKVFNTIQVGLEMVAAMPAHALVDHLLHGLPVWAEVGLALIAFFLLGSLAAWLHGSGKNHDDVKTKQKPESRAATTEVFVINSRGEVTKIKANSVLIFKRGKNK